MNARVSGFLSFCGFDPAFVHQNCDIFGQTCFDHITKLLKFAMSLGFRFVTGKFTTDTNSRAVGYGCGFIELETKR